MKYISLFDELGILLDDTALEERDLIRIQKQVKAKAVLENKSNTNELLHLIEGLKDDTFRAHYRFVESNSWIKKIITGEISSITVTSIHLNEPHPKNTQLLALFLEPYFKEHFVSFLNYNFKRGDHSINAKILKYEFLYSEQIKLLIIKFLKSKLNFAISYIENGKYVDNPQSLAFLKNVHFIKCLNVFVDICTNEIIELYYLVVDMYNKYRRNTSNTYFLYAASIMYGFKDLDIKNYLQKQTIDENASIVKTHAYKGVDVSTKSSKGFSVWAIGIVVFIIIRIVFWVSKNASNDNYNTNFYDINKGIMYKERLAKVQQEEEQLQFFDELVKNTEDAFITGINDTTLTPFSNPYPKDYSDFYVPNSIIEKHRSFATIKNNSALDLILFRLYKNNDKAIYIPQNKEIDLQISELDTLFFYAGKKPAIFSYANAEILKFREKAKTSNFYQITTKNNTEKSTITITNLIGATDDDEDAKISISSISLKGFSSFNFPSTYIRAERIRKTLHTIDD